MADKMALEQIYCRTFQLSPVSHHSVDVPY